MVRQGNIKQAPGHVKHLQNSKKKPLCWGRYLLLMQRGLSEGCSGHSDNPIQLGRGGQEVGWTFIRGINLPDLPQQNCSVSAAQGGDQVFASHHTSLLGLISSPFLLTCSHLLQQGAVCVINGP